MGYPEFGDELYLVPRQVEFGDEAALVPRHLEFGDERFPTRDDIDADRQRGLSGGAGPTHGVSDDDRRRRGLLLLM